MRAFHICIQQRPQILLVTLYSKSDHPDITADEVREIVIRVEAQFNNSEETSEQRETFDLEE